MTPEMTYYCGNTKTHVLAGPDAEHKPLSATEIARSEVKEKIKAEILHGKNEFICERLGHMTTKMISRVLSKSL